MSLLRIFNRQKTRPVDTKYLRLIALWVLKEKLDIQEFELAIHLVGPDEMARVNESFLGHEGSTDVITFNNAEPGEAGLNGEIFISVADAIDYAGQFRTSWQSEVTRYVIHGFLHLLGYDDLKPELRRVMKRHENRLFNAAASQFSLKHLARSPRARLKNRDSQ